MKKFLLATICTSAILTGCGSHYVNEQYQPEWDEYDSVVYAGGYTEDGEYFGYSDGSFNAELTMWLAQNRAK